MADCPHCGTMNEDGAMTCTNCSKPMTKDEGGSMGGGEDTSADSGM